jgi:hypothetical protein
MLDLGFVLVVLEYQWQHSEQRTDRHVEIGLRRHAELNITDMGS